jgi:2-polyprenyl-6-methoxyphenol hydroxylase-like FAD-dependent oxidoreductase
LLLGDAAQPDVSGACGGNNMALRDAVVAANHLIPAIGQGRHLESACRAVQEERDPEIRQVQTLQLREVRGQRWARSHPLLMWPMLRIAPALAKTGWPQKAWLRRQRPLRFGITKVRLAG